MANFLDHPVCHGLGLPSTHWNKLHVHIIHLQNRLTTLYVVCTATAPTGQAPWRRTRSNLVVSRTDRITITTVHACGVLQPHTIISK